MNQKSIEKNSLKVSSFVNAFMGIAGIAVYILTGFNSLLLDGVFSTIACISSVMALIISQNSHKKSVSFPHGMYFLEPLYAMFKSIATLMLLVITFLQSGQVALNYWFGGQMELLDSTPVVPYTIVMVITCFSLGYYNDRNNRKIKGMSTIIAAEARGNYVDGIISAGVGLAFFLLRFIDFNGALGFLHYTGDFFITMVLIIISYKEPCQVLTAAFKELTSSTTKDERIVSVIHDIFDRHVPEKEEKLDILIFKQGMKVTVRVYVKSPKDIHLLYFLVNDRQEIFIELQNEFESVSLDYSMSA